MAKIIAKNNQCKNENEETWRQLEAAAWRENEKMSVKTKYEWRQREMANVKMKTWKKKIW